jgi:arabinofuranan 3-O-arabinosyltransferase
MPSRTLAFLTARRTRAVLAWIALIAAVGHRAGQGWINFRQAERPDGNDGHTSIDFGGQWMMGRLLVTGHGRELYSRARHLEVARAAYRIEREPPNKAIHDADQLVEWYPGPDDDPIGGPLYPPIHAFVMAPLALIPDPYVAYRVGQAVMLGFALLAGLGIRYGTRGRWWWPAASSFVIAFPGCRGAIDLAQNSPLSLALLVWGWALMNRGRPGWGGFLWGLLAFKPVWAVSFLFALLLLRQWRAAAAMAATGAGLVLLTLPFVGVQAWFDWLHIGRLAADMYAVDRNWIFLSRDLFGIPRRMFLTFPDGLRGENRSIAGIAGWSLWLAVAATTCLVVWLTRRRATPPDPLTGPRAGLVLLAAWLCTYRFMYYDALLAAVGVVAILADPRPHFRRAWWPFATWAAVLAALLLMIENGTAPLNLDVSASIRGLKGTVTAADGSTRVTAPTFYVATGDEYPWDTVAVFALWVWCGIAVLRRRPPGSTPGG